jgi:16S rRNA (uracil1498-N3)-methyltransferase
MRRRFFVERFEGARAMLRGEAAEHLTRVLRAEPGQLYELSDGEKVWLGRVAQASRDTVEFALVEPLSAEVAGLEIRLLFAVVKFDRFEWCLEKATELGVNEIVPLAAARSEKNLVAAAEKRAERWTRILLESAQQSRRLRAPSLRAAAKPQVAFNATQGATRLLLSERPNAPTLRKVLSVAADAAAGAAFAADATSSSSVALAIGPEGGWTDAELTAARDAGFLEASLGKNILRTETAVIAALAALNYALGD